MNNSEAFTLVELIVVITILAVLWTLAFVSFQWYAMQSRDSVRLADIKTIKKTLELSAVSDWNYVNTGSGFSIEYNGNILWNQGLFDLETAIKTKRFSEVPLDPKTKLPYVYSLSEDKLEYQIAGVLEAPLARSILNQSHASGKTGIVKIIGKFNGRILSSTSGSTVNIFAVPTMIINDDSSHSISDIIANGDLVIDGGRNLPYQYEDLWYDIDVSGVQLLVNPGEELLYAWNLSNLLGSTNIQEVFLNNMEDAYSWSLSAGKWEVKNFLFTDRSTPKKRYSLVKNIIINRFAIDMEEISKFLN